MDDIVKCDHSNDELRILSRYFTALLFIMLCKVDLRIASNQGIPMKAIWQYFPVDCFWQGHGF